MSLKHLVSLIVENYFGFALGLPLAMTVVVYCNILSKELSNMDSSKTYVGVAFRYGILTVAFLAILTFYLKF